MIGALVIGFLGSFHCVGMCGPLMLNFTSDRKGWVVLSFVTYHLGRLLVYSLLGMMFGLLGTAFSLFDWQKWLSLVLGFGIVLIYALPKGRLKMEKVYYQSKAFQLVKRYLSKYFNTRLKWVFSGMLNGLLPCGLVYLAIAGALVYGTIHESVIFMVLFGLGTLPALIAVSILKAPFRELLRRFPNAITAMALVVGVMLIARGVLINEPNLNELLLARLNSVISVCF